jgi:hypothetical protein
MFLSTGDKTLFVSDIPLKIPMIPTKYKEYIIHTSKLLRYRLRKYEIPK